MVILGNKGMASVSLDRRRIDEFGLYVFSGIPSYGRPALARDTPGSYPTNARNPIASCNQVSVLTLISS